VIQDRLQGLSSEPIRLASTAGQVRQLAGEDRPQPRSELRLAGPLKLTDALMGPEQGLLDDVRRLSQGAQPRVNPGSGQQEKILAVVLDRPVLIERFARRRIPYS
jgi:hypothetical protein